MLRDYIQLPLPVRILCFGSFVNRAGSFVMVFLAIYASEQLGYGVTYATACIGVLGLGSMAGSLLGGYLADRVGRRPVMLIALFGGAVILLGLGLVTNQWLFMFLVGTFALVADLYRPAASAMIADVVSIDRRPHAFALMYISVNLGFAIAPPVGGFLARLSFESLFWIDAATMMAYGLVILFLIEESAPSGKLMEESGHRDQIAIVSAARRICQDRTFVMFCIPTLLMAFVFVQAMSTLPIYVRQCGYNNIQFGLLMSVNGTLIVLLQLPLTHRLARFNAMSIVAFGGLLIAFGFGLTSLGSSFALIASSIVVWTLGEITQAPFNQAIVTDLAPSSLRGKYLGVFNLCFALALAVGAPLGGVVLHRYGAVVLWQGACLVALIAVVLYVAIHRAVTLRMHSGKSLSPESGAVALETVSNCA